MEKKGCVWPKILFDLIWGELRILHMIFFRNQCLMYKKIDQSHDMKSTLNANV